MKDKDARITELEAEVKQLKTEVIEFAEWVDAEWVEISDEVQKYNRKNRIRFEPKMGGNPELPKRIHELYELFKNK